MLYKLEKDNVNKQVRQLSAEELERTLAYPQENFRRAYNPTAWPIEVQCAGKSYRVKGFAVVEFETYDVYHVNHLINEGKDQGLISLEYGKKAREQYPDFKDYLHAQEVNGLRTAVKHYEKITQLQKSALTEHKANKTSQQPEVEAKLEMFEDMLKKLNTWLREAGADVTVIDDVKVETTRPSLFKKKAKEEIKEENKTENKTLKKTSNGRYMIGGKMVKKEVAEAHPDFMSV